MQPSLIEHMRSLALVAVTMAAWLPGAEGQQELNEARAGHETALTREVRHDWRMSAPDDAPFQLVSIPGPVGPLAGLLSDPPDDWRRHAAIVWLTGGFPPGGIDASAWEPTPVENEQSAKVYRQLGLVMLYPTCRGGFGNPGLQESFYGEVDDVLAAIAWLRDQPSVDPDRIWLGGHSTGGTLALLVAAAGAEVCGVLSIAPVSSPGLYGEKVLTYDPTDEAEERLRAPIRFLDAIDTPTWVVTGSEDINVRDLRAMDGATDNEALTFVALAGAGHFDLLAPLNLAVAEQLGNTHGRGPLKLDAESLVQALGEPHVTAAALSDLATRERLIADGLAVKRRLAVESLIEAPTARALVGLRSRLQTAGFSTTAPFATTGDDGMVVHAVRASKKVDLRDDLALLDRAAIVARECAAVGATYRGWSVPAAREPSTPAPARTTLLDARAGHATQLTEQSTSGERLAEPVDAALEFVRYDGPLGPMNAYLARAQTGDAPAPALVWLAGGFPAGNLSPWVWDAPPVENDQSARVFRLCGLTTLYPTLRGHRGNPGPQESFYGEVDDALAAIAWLKRQPGIDPDRIWLGGHSTGATLALLVAAAGADVRGLFAFGPVDAPGGYGADNLTYDPDDVLEERLRSPIAFLDAIDVPTWIVEGRRGNQVSLDRLAVAAQSLQNVTVIGVEGGNHFDVLSPTNLLLAQQLAVTGGRGPLRLDADAVQAAWAAPDVTRVALTELETLEVLRRSGALAPGAGPMHVEHQFASLDPERLDALAPLASQAGFEPRKAGWVDLSSTSDVSGDASLAVFGARATLDPFDLTDGPTRWATLAALAREGEAIYVGWVPVEANAEQPAQAGDDGVGTGR